MPPNTRGTSRPPSSFVSREERRNARNARRTALASISRSEMTAGGKQADGTTTERRLHGRLPGGRRKPPPRVGVRKSKGGGDGRRDERKRGVRRDRERVSRRTSKVRGQYTGFISEIGKFVQIGISSKICVNSSEVYVNWSKVSEGDRWSS